MLVVDASVAVGISHGTAGVEALQDSVLIAPPLMWSEARSTLHVAMWRAEVSREGIERARGRLERIEIERIDDDRTGGEAWQLAEELGWARTYDAEYLALARIRDCKVVTLDARLRRGADRLGLVIAPMEL